MQIFGKTITLLPSAGSESAQIEQRMSKYGDAWNVQSLDAQDASALEGTFYVARAAPAAGGVGVAAGIQGTFSDTANINFFMQNGGSTKTIIPQYIKARVTVAGSTTTSVEYGIEVDSTNRYSSGGTALTGLPTNPSGGTTGAVIKHGAITAAAAGAGRVWVNAGLIRNTITIINDQYIWSFGALGAGAEALLNGFPPTTVTQTTIPVPAVALPPTASMLLHLVHVANATTAPSYEFEVGYIER